MKPKKKKSKALIEFEQRPIREILSIQKEVMDNNIKMMEGGRTICISDLPDCLHKQRLTNIVMDTKKSRIVVIALLNYDSTWQVYAGYPDVRDLKPLVQDFTLDMIWFCENIRDREQVMMMGDKLDKNTAALLFPDWDKSKYKE